MSRRGLKAITLPPGCGYGDAACEYLAGFDALGIPVSWAPIGADPRLCENRAFFESKLHEGIREQLIRLWRRPLDHEVLLLSLPPPHGYDNWLDQAPQTRRFAYVAWEVDRLPETWPPLLNRFDGVFVPSAFSCRTLVEGGIEVSVHTVPHVARRIEPVTGGVDWAGIDVNDFVFYTIGSWTTRKAMEETVRAYLATFSAKEKVVLVVKTDSIDYIELAAMPSTLRKTAPTHQATVWWTLARIIADYPQPAKVHLIADRLPSRAIDRLHTRGDCFLSLTRSEGWGLGGFDALLSGNPVIMTGWGGQCDYLGEDYPLAVRYTLEATGKAPRDNYFLGMEDALWARADGDHAGRLMRAVFEDREAARALGREMQRRLQQRFASPRVCRRFADFMGLGEAG